MPICSRSRTALRYWPGGDLTSAGTVFEDGLSGLSVSGLILAGLFSLLNTGTESTPDFPFLQQKAAFFRLCGAATARPSQLEIVLDFL